MSQEDIDEWHLSSHAGLFLYSCQISMVGGYQITCDNLKTSSIISYLIETQKQ